MPRTKGSKNRPKTVTADFAMQIAERQSAKEALTAEIASITANIDTLKADLKEKKNPQDTAHARIYDRLLELCTPIACTGPSMRTRAGQEKLQLLKTMQV